MKLHRLELTHEGYSRTNPMKAVVKIETDSGMEFDISFTPEQSAKLAAVVAEIVGGMARVAGPHLHKEGMEDPTLKLTIDLPAELR